MSYLRYNEFVDSGIYIELVDSGIYIQLGRASCDKIINLLNHATLMFNFSSIKLPVERFQLQFM